MPRKGMVKLSREKISIVIQCVKNGMTYKHAMIMAGISESAFYRYKAVGEGIEKPKNKAEAIQKEFWESLKKAEAECIQRNILLIQNAAATSWQAAAWHLERTHPDIYGRKINVEAKVETSTANKRLQEYMSGEDVDRLIDEN